MQYVMNSTTFVKDAEEMVEAAKEHYSNKPELSLEAGVAIPLLEAVAKAARAQAERISAIIYTAEEFEEYETTIKEALESITS